MERVSYEVEKYGYNTCNLIDLKVHSYKANHNSPFSACSLMNINIPLISDQLQVTIIQYLISKFAYNVTVRPV